MQRLICILFLLGISVTISIGQVSQFDTPENMYKGPFVELTDIGFNTYSWYKIAGFKFDKNNDKVASKRNDTPVTVKFLQIAKYSATGEQISKEDFPMKVAFEVPDNGVPDVLKRKSKKTVKPFLVSDGQQSFTTERNIITTSENNMTYEQLLAKFPNSDSFAGGDYSPAASVSTIGTTASVRGKGMLGYKKPYTLTLLNSEEEIDSKVELANIPTDNPKAEWRTSGAFVKIDEQGPAIPVWYSKDVKKDKHNKNKEYKLVIYDTKGQVIQEKDINFTVPHMMSKTTKVLSPSGEIVGQLYFLIQEWGLGYKKINREPNKKINTLIFVSRDGKTIEEIELNERADKIIPAKIGVIAAYKTADGIRLYTHTDGQKKKSVERSMDEYMCVNGKASLVKSHKYEDFVKNTSGKFSHKFARNMKSFDIHQQIADNNILHVGIATTKLEGKVQVEDCNYVITDPKGAIVQMGQIGIGNVNTSNKPNINIEEMKSDRLVINIDHLNLADKLWIFDKTNNDFTPVEPTASMAVQETIRRGEFIYFIGKQEDVNWIVEKFQL